jgi:DNA-binding winged helix-turn-helix (wHTH) protein
LNSKVRPSVAGNDPREHGYTFAGFRLEPDGTLFRGQSVVHLAPKELAALRVLLDRAGQIVTPHELRQALWGDVHVTADSIPKCLSSLRARLAPEDCIQTVYKRGYRLWAEVKSHEADHAAALPRLAIAPFELGPAFPEHLGLAVVEGTTDRLVNLRPAMVTVLARDSVFSLANAGTTPQQMGEKLKADLVLAGELRAMPAHYRLRARMIRVADSAEVWVEDMLVERNRTAALKNELADRLVVRLGNGAISISAAGAAAAEREDTPEQREAYEIYLKARNERHTLERHRMQDGLQRLLRATELDPSLAPAQVDLANLCCTQAILGFMSPRVAEETVRRAAQAIPRDCDEAVAVLPALGWTEFHAARNLPAAIDAFERSSGMTDNRWSLRWRVMFALSRRRFDEAIGLSYDALAGDPYSPWLHARLAWTLFLAGQTEESAEQSRRALAQFSGGDDDGVMLYAGMILAFAGDVARGVEVAAELARRHPYFDMAAAHHAYTLACAGRGDEALALLQRLHWLSRERFVLRSFIPPVYVALGEHESALAELRAAEESRCPWFFQMLADPRLKPLESHPMFASMNAILPAMEAVAAR